MGKRSVYDLHPSFSGYKKTIKSLADWLSKNARGADNKKSTEDFISFLQNHTQANSTKRIKDSSIRSYIHDTREVLSREYNADLTNIRKKGWFITKKGAHMTNNDSHEDRVMTELLSAPKRKSRNKGNPITKENYVQFPHIVVKLGEWDHKISPAKAAEQTGLPKTTCSFLRLEHIDNAKHGLTPSEAWEKGRPYRRGVKKAG